MKIATLNRGKESKYLNQYPLVDEDDIYKNDHLKEGDLFLSYERSRTVHCYCMCRTST